MRRSRARFILLLTWVLLTAAVSFAAELGQVTGHIIDSKNEIKLMGVTVNSEGNAHRTVSNRQGDYALSLPEGQHVLTFSYLGYPTITREVTVSASNPVTLNIDFSVETVAVGEVVVQGQLVGQAKALNQQKTAPNLQNVVSADAIGRFPDQNAAEALNRVPGISIERDQGEGRFVIIRGINPQLNSAAVDGIPLAAAEDGTRAVLLDVFPTNVMETLVVTKALTADMPADGIGGNVNIITPSAYDRSERTIHGSLGGNYSDLTENSAGSGQFTFGDVFGDNKQFGILASISYDERDFGSDNVEADPWALNDDGHWVTESLEYREYDLTRERLGGVLNLEFKPDDRNHFFLRGLYSEFTDHEYRRRSVIGDMLMLPSSASSGEIVGEDYEDDPEELFPTTEILLKDREETQSNWAISAGGENKVNRWTLDYKAAFSYAEQDTPFDTEFTYATDALRYSYADASGDTPSLQVIEGDPNDLDNYELDSVEVSDQLVEEESWIFAANLKRELDTSFASYLKAGAYISLRNKTNDLETTVYEDAPADWETLAGHTGGGRQTFSDLPLISKHTRGAFKGVSDQFSSERDIEASELEDYETDEDVYAAYVMGEADFGDFSILPGVRVEYTELEAKGNTFDEATEEVGSQKADNDYTNVLPSLHGKYRFNDNLILNAAWTNTISRPQWNQIFYGKFTDEDGNIEIGNPELDPYEAMNWDLTLTKYLPETLGMVSVGIFYKDIDNFIYAQTSDQGDFDLTTFRNGDSGNIAGLELAYRQKLAFLPTPFDGFSLEGSLTLTDSEADVLAPEAGGDERTVDFIRNSDTVGMAAVSYEKGGFFVRLSGTYRSSYLDELGEEAFEDRYIDDHFQLDLSSAYTFMDHYTVFANVINLTDEPLKAYWDKSERLSQYEEYGWSASAGLKFNF